MGYYIRTLPCKRSAPNWKLQFISYENKDIQDSAAKKRKKEWDLDSDRWRGLGFHSLMTTAEAKVRAKQLNAQRHLKEQEMRIQLQRREQAQALRRYDSVLPMEFVAEFEERFVRARDSETTRGLRKKSRCNAIWKAAQRVIVAVQIDPSDWLYHTHEIYDYFHRQRYSLRYMKAILKFCNLWGFFISRKLARPFLPIPAPRGYERQRLIEAFYQKERSSVSRPSRELAPEQLEAVAGKINQQNFNWLFLSVWFGLRPQEVDNLKDKNLWRVEELPNGRKILWVFQTKIIALPAEDRWKPIPILFDQQEFGVRILGSGNFRRPLLKTMKRYFEDGTTLYGGRKGFSDLMLSKGHELENISVWMGHSTLEKTWKSYKRRRKFHLAGF
jgi:hypothetical protein